MGSAILKQPDSATIMVGDFNKARLSTSSLYQYVNFNTRENSQLDLCYSNISDAYKPYKLPPLSTSDHAAVQLVPIYQTRHKFKKNTKISKQIIDDESVDKCKAVFDTTDWSLFISDDMCLTTETITDYINFTLTSNSSCEEFIINPNQRPWITSELKAKIKEKYDNRKCGDQTLRKEKQAEVNKLMSDAKLAYKNKMLAHISSNMKHLAEHQENVWLVETHF